MINQKVIWDILQLTSKFWKITTKFVWSNWINKICWIEVFFEMVKNALRGLFPGEGFKVGSYFLVQENNLSSSLLIADWLILAASTLKNSFFKYSFIKKFSTQSDFDSSLELVFWAICWSFKSFTFLDMTKACHGCYNRAFSGIGNVCSGAEFIEEVKRSFITELVKFRSRFSNSSRVELTNLSLMSG